MKKSILNSAITMTMATALFSGSVLNTQAYAGEPAPDEVIPADLAATDNSSNQVSDEDYLLPGLGVGAATGAIIAGPAGLIIGGLVGAFVGANQDASEDDNESLARNIPTLTDDDSSKQQTATLSESPAITNNVDELHHGNTAEQNTGNKQLHLAQLGPINNLGDDMLAPEDELLDAFTQDLSLDIYFRSGSTDIESFYPGRLTAIAGLLKSMDKLGKDKLELHLDGYADRRGEQSKNIALANERIEKVRQQLIIAGIDNNRINSQAFGETKTVSAVGDLEAYTFDRKVVIRFERMTEDSIASMTTALADFETQETSHADATESTDAVIAETGTRF